MKEGLWVKKKVYARKSVCWLESVVGEWVNEEVKRVFTGFILQNSVQPMGSVEKITVIVLSYTMYVNSVHL